MFFILFYSHGTVSIRGVLCVVSFLVGDATKREEKKTEGRLRLSSGLEEFIFSFISRQRVENKPGRGH